MMRLHPRVRSFLPSLSLVAASAVLVPILAGPPARGETAQTQDEDDTKLGQAMEGLRAQAKAVGKALGAKDAAAAWTAVCGMQAKILEAKQEAPATADAKPAADRPAFVNAFRGKLNELLKATCDLEADVLASKFDEAEKKLREITGPMQKAGHQAFRKD